MIPDHPFSFFDGGVAPIDMFPIECRALEETIKDCVIGEDDDEMFTDSRPSIAFIALFAFVEGFFKNTFSAIGNICPTALKNFSSDRPDIQVPLADLLLNQQSLDIRLASLIAESLDFGTAKKINGIFHSLLNISPFNSRETRKFDELLAQRNQIAHHGGLVTTKYFKQNHKLGFKPEDIYSNSIVIEPEDTREAIDFFRSIVVKLTNQAYTKMVELEGEKVFLSPEDNQEYYLFKYFRGDCLAIKTMDNQTIGTTAVSAPC